MLVDARPPYRSRTLLSEESWDFLDLGAHPADSWSIGYTETRHHRLTSPDGTLSISVEGQEPVWLHQAVVAVQRLLALPENWDSYGGQRPTLVSALKAFQVLDQIMTGDAPLPTFVPTNRGGIQLEWHRNGTDLEVEITPDGRSLVCFEDERTGQVWEQDVTMDNRPLTSVMPGLLRSTQGAGRS